VIQQFITHDDLTSNIHLFLRTSGDKPYTYMGRLGYLDHDPSREQPVYFTWQLMDWPAPRQVLDDLGIVPVAPSDPVTPVDPSRDSLTETPPPEIKPGTGTGGAGGTKPTLAGQDAKNRALGLAGERLVLLHERKQLIAAGRSDLADKIVHVAVVEGDSAGYDVRSFNADGGVRHIEVKTTAGPQATPSSSPERGRRQPEAPRDLRAGAGSRLQEGDELGQLLREARADRGIVRPYAFGVQGEASAASPTGCSLRVLCYNERTPATTLGDRQRGNFRDGDLHRATRL
jgi:hypothetical protein